MIDPFLREAQDIYLQMNCAKTTDDAWAILANKLRELSEKPSQDKEPIKEPEFLTKEEAKDMFIEADYLWRDLQENNLGGFSGGNRPFYIVYQFRRIVEKFGRRDTGLTWISKS